MNANLTNFGSSLNGQLYRALHQGNWEDVEAILLVNPEAITTEITVFNETPLLVALKGRRKGMDFIEKLVNVMPVEALALSDHVGNTALHVVAALGDIEFAKFFVAKNRALLNIWNNEGHLPIHISSMLGLREMTMFLFSVSKQDEESKLYEGEAGVKLMGFAISSGVLYDLALNLLEHNKKLAWQDFSPLEALAQESSTFPRGTRFNILHTLIYSVSPIKNARHTKQLHNQALQLVKSICIEIKNLDNAKASDVLRSPFLLAAENGNHEIVKEILDLFPQAITFVDEQNHYALHLAVMYRHEKVFKILHKESEPHKLFLSQLRDVKGNNILHLVSFKAQQHQLEHNSRAVLQMQRELQWYKVVEKFMPPQEKASKNDDGKTPLMIFNVENSNLVDQEGQWMRGMASSCIVAASLIATMMVAATVTVPGGNANNGIPIFSKEKAFIVFALSDAFAILSSTTTVIAYLSILTSRYSIDDFLLVLPSRLIIGMISLFLSVTSMMIAFTATIYLVFSRENAFIIIPTFGLACLPVTLFSYLQIPPLLNMIKSTYGANMFT